MINPCGRKGVSSNAVSVNSSMAIYATNRALKDRLVNEKLDQRQQLTPTLGRFYLHLVHDTIRALAQFIKDFRVPEWHAMEWSSSGSTHGEEQSMDDQIQRAVQHTIKEFFFAFPSVPNCVNGRLSPQIRLIVVHFVGHCLNGVDCPPPVQSLASSLRIKTHWNRI
jgi:hypothetical protein